MLNKHCCLLFSEIDADAKDLFEAADKYNIAGLKLASERILLTSLTAANAAETLALFNVHGCEAGDTFTAAVRFAANNLPEVIRTEAWSAVVAAHPMVVDSVVKAVASLQ